MNSAFPPRYFPALVCAEYDSPLDALLRLHVPADEAASLVTASWTATESAWAGEPMAIVTTVDGGRRVAALPLPDGRWAACNAFLDALYASRSEAQRRLSQLCKRGQRGYVGTSALPFIPPAA